MDRPINTVDIQNEFSKKFYDVVMNDQNERIKIMARMCSYLNDDHQPRSSVMIYTSKREVG